MRSVHYKDEYKKFLEKALDKVSFLKNIPNRTKAEIIYKMKIHQFDPGFKLMEIGRQSRVL